MDLAEQQRRLSEAGVCRHHHADQVLTEDTDGLMVGQRVWVGGLHAGRIAYLGETSFGHGDWAGIALDKPIGKHDGTVGGHQYFQCEQLHGTFSRLTRLSRQYLGDDPAEEVDARQSESPRRTSRASPAKQLGRRSASPPRRTSISPSRTSRSYNQAGNSMSPGKQMPQPVRRSSSPGKQRLPPAVRCIISPTTDGSDKTLPPNYRRNSTPMKNANQQHGASDSSIRKESRGTSESSVRKESRGSREGTGTLQVGDRCTLGAGAQMLSGTLRFVGPTQFAQDRWAGVELDQHVGRNDGSVAGRRYFECAPNHGIFAPLGKVCRLKPSDGRRTSGSGSGAGGSTFDGQGYY